MKGGREITIGGNQTFEAEGAYWLRGNGLALAIAARPEEISVLGVGA